MKEQDYNVRFIGDYFSMTVSVQGVETDLQSAEEAEEIAIELAANIIEYQYGWDVRKVSTIDIEVEYA